MRLVKNTKIALATAIVAMLVISCAHKESVEIQHSDVQVVITTQFADSVAQTRATTTAFESGDLLGLYAVKSGGELNAASNLINNHQLKVAANGAITGGELPAYYPDKSSSIDLFSYYPYQSGNATADALGVLVGIRTTQTDFSSLQASDLCYGKKLDAAPSAAPHPLQFKHSFAQLRLNFSLYEGCSAIATVKLLSIKDSAKLNLQTGVVTLLPHIADVVPFVNPLDGSADATSSDAAANAIASSISVADATSPLNFTAIIPAQSLSGPCVEITLSDGTIYYYHATTPIALKASATNTLNLNIVDKKVITASGAPAITAWGAVVSSGSLTESVNNLVTLYWLAPHADYATADKIILTVIDPYGSTQNVELIPTIDPTSSLQYALYNLNLSLKGTSYPLSISRIQIYKGATLLYDANSIVGKTISKTGRHMVNLNVAVSTHPQNWLNAHWKDAKQEFAVNLSGGSWTAEVISGNGMSVDKLFGVDGDKITVTWGENSNGALTTTTRNGQIVIKTEQYGVFATIFTTQQGVIPPENFVRIGNLWWAKTNSSDGLHNWATAKKICEAANMRLPTQQEYGTLQSSGRIWDATGMWFGPGATALNPNHAIFMHAKGFINYNTPNYHYGLNTYGAYWSSTEWDSMAYHATFTDRDSVGGHTVTKLHYYAVRCVADDVVEDAINVNGVKWAKGNLVANGPNSCVIGKPTDGGLYFQFGSLLGWKGGATGDGRGNASVSIGVEIASKPVTYTPTPTWAASPYFTGGNSSATTVPFATDGGASAIGDPCRFYLGRTWRLPTKNELLIAANYSAWTTNGSSPGVWFGPTSNWNSSNSIWLSSLGSRHLTSGVLTSVSDKVEYWASTVRDTDAGIRLLFTPTLQALIDGQFRPYGFGVRCVRD